MKIFLPNDSKQSIGGGWSAMSCLKKGMGDSITENYDEADIVLICGASLCKPEIAEQAKRDSKRVVVRCDNILRHSRNQGKGMARMQRMASVADLVIYQCQWAKDILDDFLGHPNSTIIYNGIDLDIFKPEGGKIDFGYRPVYLYASAAKGENKGWDNAYYDYQRVQKDNPEALLVIVGKVSTEVMRNNFDFFQGENYRFLGMMDTPHKMAEIYRSCDFLYGVAMNDCYSNTILEALACGCELRSVSKTGGTPELLDSWRKGREFNGLPRMIEDYKQAIQGLS